MPLIPRWHSGIMIPRWRGTMITRRPAGAEPTAPAAPAGLDVTDELDQYVTGSLRRRRAVIRLLVAVFLGFPAVALLLSHGLTGRAAFLVPATAVFVVLVDWYVGRPSVLRWQRGWDLVLLPVIVALGAALFAVGQMSWLTALAIAAAAIGRSAWPRPVTVIGVVACTALGLGVSAGLHLGYGNVVSAAIVPALGGFLANGAERRNQLIFRLRQTQAELARVAVAEERLRIARDLHDLLGHSLSLIALKAELAGRVIGPDPGRAAKEIAELETVARRSLSDVRQAVTSYRQPSLAAELAAARRMLASAGVDCRVSAPPAYSLPPAIDALLAWTVREGTTNIVRHAAARRAEIRVEVTGEVAGAELTDDGDGPAGDRRGVAARSGTACEREPAAGSGLAGLAERAASLGGSLLAGAASGGGFRLRADVPLTEMLTGPERAAHPDGAAD
ncbi:MAG: histidine kinase, partial [Nocardiopsaceae bacterium]|nr:histidine kinase [Nocardiopsaceae bacterium]